MLTLTTSGANLLLDAGWAPPWLALHDAAGGEVSIARQAISWGRAEDGWRVSANAQVLDVHAGSTIARAGFWSAPTGGVLYGWQDVADVEAYNAAGTYTLAAGDVRVGIGG